MGKPLSQSQPQAQTHPTTTSNSKKRKRHHTKNRLDSREDENTTKQQTPQTTCDSVSATVAHPHNNSYNDDDDHSSNGSPTGGLPHKSPRSLNHNHPSSRLSEIETEDRTAASSIEDENDVIGSSNTTSHSQHDHHSSSSRRFSSSDDSHLELRSYSDDLEDEALDESAVSAPQQGEHRHHSSNEHSTTSYITLAREKMQHYSSTVQSTLIVWIVYVQSMLGEDSSIALVRDVRASMRHYTVQAKQYWNSTDFASEASDALLKAQLQLRNYVKSVSEWLMSMSVIETIYDTIVSILPDRSSVDNTFTTVRNKSLQLMASAQEATDLRSLSKSAKNSLSHYSDNIKLLASSWLDAAKQFLSLCESPTELKSWMVQRIQGFRVWCNECITSMLRRFEELRSIQVRQVITSKWLATKAQLVEAREALMTRLATMKQRVLAESEARFQQVQEKFPKLNGRLVELKNRITDLLPTTMATSISNYSQQSIDYVSVKLQTVKAQTQHYRDLIVIHFNAIKSEVMLKSVSMQTSFLAARQTMKEVIGQSIEFVMSFGFLLDYVPDTLRWIITTIIPEPITKAIVPSDSRLALFLKRDPQSATAVSSNPEVEPETVLALACDTWVSCHSQPAHVAVRDFQSTLKGRLQSILGLKVQSSPSAAINETTTTTSGGDALSPSPPLSVE